MKKIGYVIICIALWLDLALIQAIIGKTEGEVVMWRAYLFALLTVVLGLIGTFMVREATKKERQEKAK